MTTTGPETVAPFTAETYQNELATGADAVDAVVTVAATGDAAAAPATPAWCAPR